MAFSVTHNIAALNTNSQLSRANRALNKSLQKLSNGYRINVGADGPADLVISEKMRAQTVGLERAVRNTQEAMNVIGIAEGALTEMNEILRSMRALALHAANNGITSPEQVAADQSEVDSSIQTIDRIANTTKYSTQFLLNGSQSLTHARETTIDRATDHTLLDLGRTRFEQIFKRDDFSVNVTYSGAEDANESYTDGAAQARKAMFEAARGLDANTDIDTTSGTTLSADQRFTLTGSDGSRSFQFASGSHLGEVVSAINNVADSTGVGATLTFNTTHTGTVLNADSVDLTAGARTTGTYNAYHLDSTFQQKGAHLATHITVAVAGGLNGQAGREMDGDGRIYLQWTSATTYDVYKDRDLTMLLATGGQDGVALGAGSFIRNADLVGGSLTVSVAAGAAAADDVTVVQLGSAHEVSNAAANGIDASLATGLLEDATNGGTTLSGVRLGYNTDSHGKLYIKAVAESAAGASDGAVYVYKDSAMRDEDLVASAVDVDLGDPTDAADTAPGFVNVAVSAVALGNGAGPTSGLYGTLVLDEAAFTAVNAEVTAELAFTGLGVRLYSSDYGADAYVKVDAQEGALWSYYKDADDNTNATLLDSSAGAVSSTVYGQNATVAVNGRSLELRGIAGTVATQDVSSQFAFNEGELGLTRVAQVGYDVGSLRSGIAAVNDVGSAAAAGNHATNAIHNTSEVLDDFVGGMQFQLGEGAGDQERTVFTIRSMAVTQLGAVAFYDDFAGQGIKEEKTLTLQDVLGGGLASLATDPTRAMRVIDAAIDEVSAERGRLGAYAAGLLTTNANSLNVAIEMITHTESFIRDTNMAEETAEFTRAQILTQTSTAMLAQANATSQNVLRLLQ